MGRRDDSESDYDESRGKYEDDEDHDEVLEGRGDDHAPDLVLAAVHLLGHVALQGLGLDGEVDAGFLLEKS